MVYVIPDFQKLLKLNQKSFFNDFWCHFFPMCRCISNYKFEVFTDNEETEMLKDDTLLNEKNQSLINMTMQNFISNPTDQKTLNDLINAAIEYNFPICPRFFTLIVELLQENINTNQTMDLIEIIISKFPARYFIKYFPHYKIIQALTNYDCILPQAISILTFFIQNIEYFPKTDRYFFDLGVVEKIEGLLKSPNEIISNKALVFFRYLLKSGLPFIPRYIKIYNDISEMALLPKESVKILSAQIIYHFTKKYFLFCENNNKEEHKHIHHHRQGNIHKGHHKNHHENIKNNNKPIENSDEMEFTLFSKTFLFPDVFDESLQLQLQNDAFLYYLMKLILFISNGHDIYKSNSEKILKMTPIIQFALQNQNGKIVLMALTSLYKIMRHGRETAFLQIYNSNLINLIFHIYYRFGFLIQKEAIFVFIELSRFMNSNDLIYCFENHHLLQIFIDAFSSDDNKLLEDLFFCFLNIFDAFDFESKLNYFIKYFNTEEFVNSVQEMDPECSTYYQCFVETLNSVLSQNMS